MALSKAEDKALEDKRIRARKFWRGMRGLIEAEKEFRDTGPVRDSSFYEFLGFAIERIHMSKAQFVQDLWALWEHGEKRGGYFVEFGAAGGQRLSNTFMLERKYGWTGILGEPNPSFHEMLAKRRKAPVCTDLIHRVSGETMRFAMHERGLLSGVVDTNAHAQEEGVEQIISLETISLNDMLDRYDAPDTIDFMSIDTEGAELDILKGFDFDAHRVQCFTVEAKDHEERKALIGLFEANGYVHRWPDFLYKELFMVDASRA
ncbi:MAG: FkbM family methyltransferase [Pseudomonadota bacterium]